MFKKYSFLNFTLYFHQLMLTFNNTSIFKFFFCIYTAQLLQVFITNSQTRVCTIRIRNINTITFEVSIRILLKNSTTFCTIITITLNKGHCSNKWNNGCGIDEYIIIIQQ